MFVTLLGILIEDRPLQFQKAPLPMLVTPLGISIVVRLVQPEYLQIIIYQQHAS